MSRIQVQRQCWQRWPRVLIVEKASDEAYDAMWDALNAFAAELEGFTGGQVTQADAKLMARNPKYSARLDALMARVA